MLQRFTETVGPSELKGLEESLYCFPELMVGISEDLSEEWNLAAYIHRARLV